MRKILLIVVLGFTAFVMFLGSCKKKEEETVTMPQVLMEVPEEAEGAAKKAYEEAENEVEEADENRKFAEKHEIDYPILDDSSGETGRVYGAKTTPHMFVIDGEQRIVYSGGIDNAPMGRIDGEMVNYVDKVLEQLTSGEKISVESAKPYGCSVKYAD
jgi:hypothetical protein